MKNTSIIGKRFGMVVVTGFATNKGCNSMVFIKCDCGNSKTAFYSNVSRGRTQSCGCRLKAWRLRFGESFVTHGNSRKNLTTPEYICWMGMKRRCQNPNSPEFKLWGGRGIRVCKRWLGRDGFANFLNDMGKKPSPNHSIDRINSDGNYEPGNCRWATPREQANNMRVNRIIFHLGERNTLAEWSRKCGVPYKTLHARLANGIEFKRAILGTLEPISQKEAESFL